MPLVAIVSAMFIMSTSERQSAIVPCPFVMLSIALNSISRTLSSKASVVIAAPQIAYSMGLTFAHIFLLHCFLMLNPPHFVPPMQTGIQ